MGSCFLYGKSGGVSGKLPQFTYTGTYDAIQDDKKNWRIKFLTSGTLVFPKTPPVIDVFLVGGGASGGSGGGAGGGGGYTLTQKRITLEKEKEYQIVVGAGGPSGGGSMYSPVGPKNGGASTAFGYTASGANGKNGGSGGGAGDLQDKPNGGSDGSDGYGRYAGTGQHTTTREFGEPDGELYAGGGAGGTGSHQSVGSAGAGGGGQGSYMVNGYAGKTNTGGGGGCGGIYQKQSGDYEWVAFPGGPGGSGIVIIRNHKEG